MKPRSENPGALAGADRAEVTMLVGKNDFLTDTPVLLDQQVRRLRVALPGVARRRRYRRQLAFSKGGA